MLILGWVVVRSADPIERRLAVAAIPTVVTAYGGMRTWIKRHREVRPSKPGEVLTDTLAGLLGGRRD